MKRTRVVLALSALVVVTAFVAGCASENRATRDAPVDANLQDNQAPLVINFPDGYMNVSVKCLDGDLIVAHTRQAAPSAVPGATACRPGEAEKLGIPRVRGVVPSG
jgi:hypothetical protein